MKTQELKIEAPKGFEIDTKNSTFERIVFKETSNSFENIFKYHNTTQEDFEKLYVNIPSYIKYYEKECMLVSYYNKKWTADFNNTSKRKYYPWFYMDNFRLNCVVYGTACSYVPSRLLWKNEEDLKEAVELYPEIFKKSRLS